MPSGPCDWVVTCVTSCQVLSDSADVRYPGGAVAYALADGDHSLMTEARCSFRTVLCHGTCGILHMHAMLAMQCRVASDIPRLCLSYRDRCPAFQRMLGLYGADALGDTVGCMTYHVRAG